MDLGRYKRLVQAFWDPEPRNYDVLGACIWCLGRKYASQSTPSLLPEVDAAGDQGRPKLSNGTHSFQDVKRDGGSAINGASQMKQQASDSYVGNEWPPDFLDDCESRIWFTYRSNFPAIKKSSEASMTFSVRLRSLGDQAGFTSDTGWGCMIRSGQSLLANALLLLRLGRGTVLQSLHMLVK